MGKITAANEESIAFGIWLLKNDFEVSHDIAYPSGTMFKKKFGVNSFPMDSLFLYFKKYPNENFEYFKYHHKYF